MQYLIVHTMRRLWVMQLVGIRLCQTGRQQPDRQTTATHAACMCRELLHARNGTCVAGSKGKGATVIPLSQYSNTKQYERAQVHNNILHSK